LIERSRGTLPVVRPRLPGRFEPTGLDFTDSENDVDFSVDPSSQTIGRPIPPPHPIVQSYTFEEARPPTPIEVQTNRPRAEGKNSQLKGVSDDHRDNNHPPPPELQKPLRTTPSLPSKPGPALNPNAELGKGEPTSTSQSVPSLSPPVPTLVELMTSTVASDTDLASPTPLGAGMTAADNNSSNQPQRSHAKESRHKPERKSTHIEVRIGNIEVRAAKPASPVEVAQKTSRQEPRISLNDYLENRKHKKR
jgi:hypothetical protein